MGRGKDKKKQKKQGKKARTKAKLDRHWGQHVDDDEIKAAKYRKGRSRLLQNKGRNGSGSLKKSNRSDAGRDQLGDQRLDANNIDESSGFSSNEEGSDTDSESPSNHDVGGALDSLLSSIGGSHKHRHNRGMDSDNDDYDMDEREEEEEEEEVDQYESEEGEQDDDESIDESSDEEQLNGDDNDDGELSPRGEDGFAAHFNKAPLPESGEAQAKAVASLQKLRKIPSGSSQQLDSSLEVMLSGPILERLQDASNNKNDATFNNTFNQISDGYYASLRQVLAKNWKRVNAKSVRRNVDGNDEQNTDTTQKKKKRLTALQSTIFPSLLSYADLQITAESRDNRDDINNLLALHVLNHVLTSRGRVQKHNKRIKESRERMANNDNDDGSGGEGLAEEADEERWRDQGYTRPKVLILLPTRGTALTFAKRMISLMGESAYIDHLERFEAEYSAGVEDMDDDEDERNEEQAAQRRKAVLESKGEDWNELFGEQANDDDDFKIGMSLTPNAARRSKKGAKKGTSKDSSGNISVKFYSEFYRSDIILASPLALKMATSGDEENDGDVDFLSSIEVCLVLHADVLLMQNLDHVTGCLEVLNHQPTKSNDTDFSRVRNYLLAGQAAYWRQLVFVSRLADPYIMSTFKRHAKSIAGRLKLRRKVPADEATICDVLVRVRQVFQRVPCDIKTQGDDRLKYFSGKVLPQIIRLRQKRTLIYIPSYFDFVALRNLLMKNDATTSDFVSVTEYSRVSEVSRGRARFNQGRKAIMLYTGRAHFFLRHKIKGARHLVLFGLPEHAEFYSDLMNMLWEGPSGKSETEVEAPRSCLALFTKCDAYALERIVGTKHCDRMVKGEKNTFLFCS